jgi:hypothetical protein
VLLPEPAEARTVLSATLGALESAGGDGELQRELLDHMAGQVFGVDTDRDPIRPIDAATLVERTAAGATTAVQAARLVAVLEWTLHPLEAATAAALDDWAREVGVDLDLLHDARRLAEHHVANMYADLQRQNWYTHETLRGIARGQFWELLRSKVAYSGIAADRSIARKWEALRDLPAGSWGRGVADFYERHHFPFPGERHGIYEIGARHDFVHVLTDYEATPEGELDVFAFIAAAMPDDRGLVLLAVTLGLFQDGAIHRVAGKEVRLARTDTLSDPGATPRWVEAMARGAACTVDVMGGIDHFELAPLPLVEVRERFHVLPRVLSDGPPTPG